MANLSKSLCAKSVLLAFGDLYKLKLLVNQINEQFSVNNDSKYKNSSNKIEIIEEDSVINRFEMRLRTKYYNLDIQFDLLAAHELTNEESLDEKLENYKQILDKDSDFYLEGVLVLFDNIIINENLNNLVSKLIKTVNNQSQIGEEPNEINRLNLFVLNDLDEKNSQLIDTLIESFGYLNDFLKIDLSSEKPNKESTISDDQDDDEDNFSEFDELINSLFVHPWHGIGLDTKETISSMDIVAQASAAPFNEETVNIIEQAIINCENQEVEEGNMENFNFENLLLNLQDMKEKALNMNFDDRKKYAEQVVLNFWKSMGGNPDEIEDLDEED
jgi:hypothetical protein